MSVTDRSALFLALALTGCDLVLDLDAEGAVAGATGGGAGAGGTGGDACEGHARFDGQQLIAIEDDPHLDKDDDLSIVARLRLDAGTVAPGGGVYAGTVFSRVDPAREKGYELALTEPDDDGAVYPELRVSTGEEPCTCRGTLPVPADRWVSVAAVFATKKLGPDRDAAVFVDGQLACEVSCDDEKPGTFHGVAAIGAASDLGSGFFVGAIAEISIRRFQGGDVAGGCGAEAYLHVSFDAALEQSFAADCPDAIELTLGASSAPGPDDPEVVTCP